MSGNGYLIIIIVLAVTNLLTAAILLRRKADRVLLPSFDDYVSKHDCSPEQGSTRTRFSPPSSRPPSSGRGSFEDGF